MLKRSSNFAAPWLALSAAAVIGIGVLNQVLAQDNAADDVRTERNADAVDEADDDTAQPNANVQSDTAERAAETPSARSVPADDAAPRFDDLKFDDQRAIGDTPPALPGSDDADNRRASDDNISPSDRTLNGRDEVQRGSEFNDFQGNSAQDHRHQSRRFDYDDPSQPIPEEQARHQGYGQGCHPCGTRRVYYNPCGGRYHGCGGCGQSYGNGYQRQENWNGSESNGYQTQRQNPRRSVIGVTIDDRDRGVAIVSVVPNSPAEMAGLQAGDRLIAIGGRDLHSAQHAMQQIGRMSSGQSLSLTIQRNDERQEFDAEVREYAQVFGNGNGAIASDVPAPPRDTLARRGEPRQAFRPNYDSADSSQERLERVQMRVRQLERELTALRKEEVDLQRTTQQADETATDNARDAGTSPDIAVDDITSPAEESTPAREDQEADTPVTDADATPASTDASDADDGATATDEADRQRDVDNTDDSKVDDEANDAENR